MFEPRGKDQECHLANSEVGWGFPGSETEEVV